MNATIATEKIETYALAFARTMHHQNHRFADGLIDGQTARFIQMKRGNEIAELADKDGLRERVFDRANEIIEQHMQKCQSCQVGA